MGRGEGAGDGHAQLAGADGVDGEEALVADGGAIRNKLPSVIGPYIHAERADALAKGYIFLQLHKVDEAFFRKRQHPSAGAMAEADATTWNTLRVGSNLTLDFLRIALSSLAESKTDIDELRAWEFDGPFLRDFSGRAPSGRRDAGAIER